MQQEGGVRDDPGLRQAREVAREQLLQVDVGLLGLHHRQRDLHAVLRGDRPVALADDRHLAAGAGLEAGREGGQVVAGLAHGVDHHHAGNRLGRRGRDGLGFPDARLVSFDLAAEAVEGNGVAGSGADELGEELALRLLRHLRTLRVEGRQGCHALHQKERHRGEPVGRLLGARPVENGRVGVDAFVDDADGLHGRGQAVRVVVHHEDRSLGGELADLDEARAGRVGLAVADEGVDPAQLPHAVRCVRDLRLPRVAGVGDVVVVADDHLDPLGDQRLHGRHQVGRRGGVDEDDPLRSLRDGGHDGLVVGYREELGEVDRGVADGDVEHVVFLLFGRWGELVREP